MGVICRANARTRVALGLFSKMMRDDADAPFAFLFNIFLDHVHPSFGVMLSACAAWELRESFREPVAGACHLLTAMSLHEAVGVGRQSDQRLVEAGSCPCSECQCHNGPLVMAHNVITKIDIDSNFKHV